LIDRGHEVIGTFRSPENAERVRALGAEPIALDLLDTRAVRMAVLEAEPEAIVHQATALADVRFSRKLDRTFAQTNRLRIEGTDALLKAAREADVRRFVAQSFASYRYAREGGPVKTEDDPLDPTSPRHFPRWLARLFAGEAGVVMGTHSRGASNAKAKHEFGWTLRYPSWRQGFVAAYASTAATEERNAHPAGRTSHSPT
jgi:nucleoside-diphosphate-sugar epimerase